MMKLGVPKEILPDETRVAATPETVAKMTKADIHVIVEAGAGLHASIQDQDYIAAGATIETQAKSLLNQADLILKVNRPLFNEEKRYHEIDYMKEKAILISPLYLAHYPDLMTPLTAKKITAFSLDLVPRIARAQSMDILSSMSNLAGYKSIVMAANYLDKIFPMMTTAAGTIRPAKIIVIGAGVAGLQAIATARRLGGVVIAFDTRPIVAEQVKSLGADFVSLETSHDQSEEASGYAKEQSAEFYKNEQNIIRKYLREADVVITTALIPGKRAPLLITEAMVQEMRPGSVIVDLATEQEGNCALSEPGKITVKYGITLIALLNLPRTMPADASRLYARNILAFMNYILPQLKETEFDLTDDIIKNCLVTYQGERIFKG